MIKNIIQKLSKTRKLRMALLFVSLLMPLTASAYFQDMGMGVRTSSMGEAFAGVADDSNALLFNIAGIADLNQQELNFMYSNLLANLNARLYTGQTDILGYHNFAGVFPFSPQIGSFGFYWTQFASTIYKENTVAIGYARTLNDIVPIDNLDINAGVSIKTLYWQVSANDYTVVNPIFQNNGLSRQGLTADLGLLVKLPGNLKFGLSLENIIPVDLGMTVQEIIPLNLRLGSSYSYHLNKGTSNTIDYVLGSMDYTYRNDIHDIRAGMEVSFLNHLFKFRIGTTADQFTTGVGLSTPLGDTPRGASIDYAFIYPYGIQDTWGSHRVSLIIRWGRIEDSKIDAQKQFELENLELTPASFREFESSIDKMNSKPVNTIQFNETPLRNQDGTTGSSDKNERFQLSPLSPEDKLSFDID